MIKIIGTFCHDSRHLSEVLVELKYANKGAKKIPIFVNPDMHIFVCCWLDFCEIGGLVVTKRRIASAKQQSGKNPFGFPAAIFQTRCRNKGSLWLSRDRTRRLSAVEI